MFIKLWNALFAPEGDGGVLGGDAGGGAGAGDAAAAKTAADAAAAAAAAKGGGGGATPTAWLTESLDEKGEFKPGWTDKLPDGLKPAKETLGRYKTIEAALFGLHNANELLGKKSGAIVIPTDKSTPEEIAAFRKALNVPEKVEGYELKAPEKLPEGVVWDQKRLERYLPIFHKHNISKAAVNDLLSLQIEDQATLAGMESEMSKAYVGQQKAELQKEWGDKTIANIAKCRAIMPHLGLSPDDPALAHASVARALLKAHAMITSEDGRLEGKTITTDEPGIEADRIQTDKTHALYEAYQNASHPRHDEAVNTLRTLRQQSIAQKKVA